MNTAGFNALVQEAAQVVRHLRQLDTLAAHKLSATAFPREAIRAAGCTIEQLAKWRQQIESGALEHLNAAVRRMVAAVRSPNITAPPREMRRLSYLLTDAALAEGAALGMSPFAMFALAVQIAAEKHPEDFGEAESFGAVERRLRDLTARRDELYARIATAWTSEDLLIDPADLQGRHVLWIKMSNRNVPLAPAENLGERLVNWMLENRT